MNTKSNVVAALNVLDDFILKQRMGLYLYLRNKLKEIQPSDMRDYIDSLDGVEERMMNQVNNIRRSKATADMYNPKVAGEMMKKERHRQMSLRKILDGII